MRHVAMALLTGALLVLPPTLPQRAVAQDSLLATERCIRLNRIDRTRVVDDQNILFYMKGGDIYLNKLSRACPGLAIADTFMYRTSTNQLCDVDMITVLRNLGFGFQSGASCRLSAFIPLDAPTAEELLRSDRDR